MCSPQLQLLFQRIQKVIRKECESFAGKMWPPQYFFFLRFLFIWLIQLNPEMIMDNFRHNTVSNYYLWDRTKSRISTIHWCLWLTDIVHNKAKFRSGSTIDSFLFTFSPYKKINVENVTLIHGIFYHSLPTT